MRKVIGITFVVFAVTVFAMTAFAQPGGGGGGRERGERMPGPGGTGRGGGARIETLIRNDEIKRQLGLSEEQVGKLEKLSEEMRPNRGAGAPGETRQGEGRPGEGRPGATPPSREEMQKFREEMEKRIDESLTKVNLILTPEQQEKLKVLQFQLSGGLDSPFLNVRSLAALNLSDEQKAKMKTMNEEREAEARASFEKRGPIDWRSLSQEERDKLGDKFRAENDARTKKFAEQIKTVLTPEQKEKAEKLTAEAKAVQEKVGIGNRDGERGERGERGGDRRRGERSEEGFRPENSTFRPGQGGVGGGERSNRQPRRNFPQSE